MDEAKFEARLRAFLDAQPHWLKDDVRSKTLPRRGQEAQEDMLWFSKAALQAFMRWQFEQGYYPELTREQAERSIEQTAYSDTDWWPMDPSAFDDRR
jgi:hypothetical protein